MTEHQKKIYDDVKRGRVYKQVDSALEFFEEISRRSYHGEFMQDKFPHFLQLLIEAARKDEEAHQKAIDRIENLKNWIGSSQFNDTSTLYMIPIKLLGYDNLEDMKKEVAEYAPDLLDEFAIFKKGMGDSFLLKDYEANKDNSTQSPTVVEETIGSSGTTKAME